MTSEERISRPYVGPFQGRQCPFVNKVPCTDEKRLSCPQTDIPFKEAHNLVGNLVHNEYPSFPTLSLDYLNEV